MKTTFLRVILATGLLVAVAVGARAQDLDTLVVNVPFGFVVGNTTLPAGTYTVNRVQFNNPNSLQLRSADGSLAVLTTVAMTGAPDATLKAVFNRYGNQIFLHEIRTAGGKYQLFTSRSERKMAEMMRAEHVSASGSK